MDILGRNRAAEELTQEIDAATDVVENTGTGVNARQAGGGGVVINTETGTRLVNARGLGNVALREGNTVQFGFGGEKVQSDWQEDNKVLGAGDRRQNETNAEEDLARGRYLEGAERELARVEAEVAQPERFVGEETPLLEEERQQEDLADLRREENVAPSGASEAEKELLASEHRIVRDASREVTKATMQDVEEILREKVVHPADLANLWMDRSIKMIKEVDGYDLGDNN